MSRNRIILSNLPLVYIKEILKSRYTKYIEFDGYKIHTGYDNQLLCYSCNQKKRDISPMALTTALREGYATKKSVEQAVRKGKPKALVGV